MSTDWFGFFLVGLAFITSYIAFTNRFPLLKFGAAVMWIALYMWIKDYSPTGTEGNAFQTVALLGAIVMVLAIPLSQLSRDIKTTRSEREGFSQMSEEHTWHLPSWLRYRNPAEDYREKQAQKDAELQAYRDQLRRALNPDEIKVEEARARRARARESQTGQALTQQVINRSAERAKIAPPRGGRGRRK